MAPATPVEYVEAVLPSVATLSTGTVLDNALRFRSRVGRRLLAALACPEQRSGPGGYTAFDARAKDAELHLGAYCDLAYALAAQPLSEGDQDAALAMYGRARRILGGAVPERDQVAHVRLAALRGDRVLLEALRKTYGRVSAGWWRAAEYAVSRAEDPSAEERWLPAFLSFAGWSADLALAERGPEDNLLARLVPKRVEPVEDGPLISVVMTAYRPGPELLTAVRSVLAQSWRRLELLLVDDASEPEYDAVLLEAAGLDERVHLLRQRVNGGTYRARNRAIGIARGTFLTGLDSDDWAHPRWLEKQAAPLLAEPDLAMTIGEGIRCSAELEPAISPVLRLTEPRSTSIMYRTDEVRQRIGFYDTVLKSGDTEFKLRIQRTFGKERVRILYGEYFTVVRQRVGSLSDGDVSAEWVHPSRFAYNGAFKQWHKRIQRGKAESFLAASASERPFPAPRQLLEWDALPDRFDLVAAADWRHLDQGRRELLERAAASAADGAAVALVHYAAWNAVSPNSVNIAPEALAFAAEHGLEFVDPGALRTETLVAADESLVTALREDYSGLEAAAVESPEEPETAGAPAELRRGSGRRVLRRQAKRLLKRSRRLVAAGLAGVAAAVLTLLFADLRVALAVAAAAAVLELGLAAVLLTRMLDTLARAAVAPLPESAQGRRRKASARTVLAPLPARKLRPLKRWTARLNTGFSATALPVMYQYARNQKGTYAFRLAMLEAIVSWRDRVRRERREPLRGHLDIVLVSNLNLMGGTTASNAEEVKAYRDAGLTVGLLHHPVYEWNVGREVNPKVAELLGDDVVLLGPDDEVTCDLMIVRFPPSLSRLLDDRPKIAPVRTVLLINQTPFESYGPGGGGHFSWDIATVRGNLEAWVGESTWYAIGPSVRDTLERYHADELAGVDLADGYWFGSLDPDLWRRDGRREDDGVIRIGRHSRDHMLKWQTIAEDLRASYPDAPDVEIRILGGTEAPERILGRLPANWTSHPFGSMPAVEFLHTLDVAVYFTAEEYVEAFGRSPMEAMAAGLPCIMPPQFEPLFGDGGLYCEPEEVEDLVRSLMADPERYRKQSERSLATVREHFSHEALLRRVAALGVRVPGPAAAAAGAVIAEGGKR